MTRIRSVTARTVLLDLCSGHADLYGKGIARRLEELQAGSYGIRIIGIKQRVEDLGGQLAFRNTAPGTTVEVTIPAKNARGQSVVGRL
jgi:glucose-6-phosphate-specific signal transduction histidine kinase